ncbi:hypothetical protein J41TS12_15310 [Paenibacillus antibioticophila]|uniref:Beta-xylanase n=2 Tax=Paenibacillus antibioticophila TaxID=1274374 RepID=A0A920CEJ3_9BACL|nr:hypothetical protein J41TS12_15310 [Paenibacillus antibioticophila]
MKSQMIKRTLALSLALTLILSSGLLPSHASAESSGINDTATIYREDFANGKGAATQAGNSVLTPVTDKYFEGNEDGAALYVSNRENNWDGADFRFADIGLKNGQSYTVTVSVYIDADTIVPDDAQIWLQTVDSYKWLDGKNVISGGAIILTKEFTVDTAKDSAIRVQSNDAGAGVPYYIGDIHITGAASSGGEDPPREPALPFNTITFEDQSMGGFAGRAGTETLSVTNEANHTDGGGYALKVEGRSETWHGPTIRVEKHVDKGHEYKISAWVKLISPESAQLQLSTQIGEGSSANYVALAPKTIRVEDGWVLLEGNYRYNSVGNEFLTLYVESSSSKDASFYIDDISFEATGSGTVDIERDLVPLKDAYASDFLIGNAITAEDLEGIRFELLKMHYGLVTAGNAMKPDALQKTKGSFTFDSADALVNQVLDAGMQMHGHVLVWHQQSPDWLNMNPDGSPLQREEALDNLRTHIRTVMEHFGDRVISWDVVNEAMNDNPANPADWENALRKSPWYQAIGPDYLEQAFLAAREVLDDHPDWNIKLYYNDYNDDNRNKATAIYSMVKELNEKYAKTHPGKLLVDGIGMQGHYNINTNPENVRLSLEQFISLGVEVGVTELDIQAGSDYQLTDKQAEAQGYLYAQLMQLYKEHSEQISRVTFWGQDDGTSWRASSNPLLFDKNLQAKPAYYAVIDPAKFIAEHQPDSSEARQSTAKYATPVIDGVADAIWKDTPAVPIDQYQTAWQGASGTARVLWDDENLYVLLQVNDAQLDKTNANAWEQDSVEIFLDENNARTTFYQTDDGQYRVNFDNEVSFNPESLSEGFVSATRINGSSYTVEAKLPFKTVSPANQMKIGFDVQINDAKDGSRQSVAAWNDTTGNGYQDTSVYGVLTLIGKPDGTPGNGGSDGSNNHNGSGNSIMVSPSNPVSSSSEKVLLQNGKVIIQPVITTSAKQAKAVISASLLNKAMAQAKISGTKTLTIELPAQADALSYEIELPEQSVKALGDFGLLIITDYAELDIPANSLQSDPDSEGALRIRIGRATLSDLSADEHAYIGDRPTFGFMLEYGGETVTTLERPVVVKLPYTLTAVDQEHPERLVVWFIGQEAGMQTTPIVNSRFNQATNQIVFETDQLGNYATAYIPPAFNDVQPAHWAGQAIGAMTARSVLAGNGSGSFSPAQAVTSSEFAAALIHALGLNAQEAAAFAALPNDAVITRQDMFVLTAQALAAAGIKQSNDAQLATYSDAASVPEYARDSAAALISLGIINGKNRQLAPQDALTRAEAAVILYRAWSRL